MSKEICLHCNINLIANVYYSDIYASTCDNSPTCRWLRGSCLEDAFMHLKLLWPTSVRRFVDPLCFPSGEDREHLNSSFFCMLNWSVFWPSLSFRLCCIGEKPSVQPAVLNTCKCEHSCFTVLQGLFLLFCSSLRSFALHLDPNAVNISIVVRLAPFIINRSPSTVKGKKF